MERQHRIKKPRAANQKPKDPIKRGRKAHLPVPAVAPNGLQIEAEPVPNPEPKPENERLTAALLQPGDLFSTIIYNKVMRVDQHYLHVENQHGYSYQIHKEIAENEGFSASQFVAEKRVTRTELCELLENAGDAAFTINFLKKPTDERAKQLLETLRPEDLVNPDVLRQLSKGMVKGEESTIVGYLRNREPKMGRSTVIDLNAPRFNNIRLVDHRTINWMIFKNTKYIAK